LVFGHSPVIAPHERPLFVFKWRRGHHGGESGFMAGKAPTEQPWAEAARRCHLSPANERPAAFRRMSRWGTPTRGRLTAQSVALVVKRCVVAVGQNPKLFGGHSLRAGLATKGGRRQRDRAPTERDIMHLTPVRWNG